MGLAQVMHKTTQSFLTFQHWYSHSSALRARKQTFSCPSETSCFIALACHVNYSFLSNPTLFLNRIVFSYSFWWRHLETAASHMPEYLHICRIWSRKWAKGACRRLVTELHWQGSSTTYKKLFILRKIILHQRCSNNSEPVQVGKLMLNTSISYYC